MFTIIYSLLFPLDGDNHCKFRKTGTYHQVQCLFYQLKSKVLILKTQAKNKKKTHKKWSIHISYNMILFINAPVTCFHLANYCHQQELTVTSLYKHTAKLDFFILNLVQINLVAGTKDNNIGTCVLWSRIQQKHKLVASQHMGVELWDFSGDFKKHRNIIRN